VIRSASVLGGTGFVGLSIVDALLAQGVSVRVLRRRRSITALVRRRPVELVSASLDEPASLVSAFTGVDAVFYAAAHYPRYSLDPPASVARATEEARAVFDAALVAGAPSLVLTSSIAILEPRADGRPSTEADVPYGLPCESPYRAVKWAIERELDVALARGLRAVSMLPGGCLGPGDVRLGTGGLLVGVVRGDLPWMVDGLVHAVDVRDVALAHVRAATRGKSGDRYALPGRSMGLRALLARIVSRHGGALPRLVLSAQDARDRADAEEREAAPARGRVPFPRELVDIVVHGHPVSGARAARDLGFKPRPLDRSIDDAVEWFRRFSFLGPAEETDRRRHAHG
jgi:dihydroflavonol-4-reductase